MELFGRIVDRTSRKPVEKAKVTLKVGNEELAIRYSDNEGKFDLKEAAHHIGEDLTYKVEKDGDEPFEGSIKIEGTKVHLSDIELVSHEIEVELSFEDESDNPLENVEIILKKIDGEKVGEGSTNKDGLLKLSLGPELEGEILSYKGEIANFEAASGDIELKRKTSCEITMSRSPVIVISGKVEDNAGKSLVGVGVRLIVGDILLAELLSGNKGEFEHEEKGSQYAGQEVKYFAEKEGYLSSEGSVKIQETGARLLITLNPVPPEVLDIEVELSFKDESNNPLENLEITLEVDGKKVGEGSTNKDGLFKLSLGPELEGKSLSYKGEIANFEVSSGDIGLKKKTSCEITMSRSPVIVISGKVEDNAGKSLVGARVSLIVDDRELAVLRSDDKGEFEHEEKGSQYAGKEVKYVAEKDGYHSSEGSAKIQETGARLLTTLNPVPPTISTIESKPGKKPPIIPIIIGIIAIVLIIAIWPFNSPPETPSKPNGPISGEPGTSYTYSTYATDPDGDKVIYTFDWGDGTTSESQSGQATHYWSEERSYEVRAMATDINGASSGWSDPLVVTISQRPPETPKKPTGPGTGTVGIPYYYTTQATDPDGDDVKYTFDWGDGTTEETVLVSSGIPAQKSHIWSSAKTYKVRAKATDSNGASSGWSSALDVTISQRRPTTPERPTGPTGTAGITYAEPVTRPAGMEALKKMLHEK